MRFLSDFFGRLLWKSFAGGFAVDLRETFAEVCRRVLRGVFGREFCRRFLRLTFPESFAGDLGETLAGDLCRGILREVFAR